MLEIIAIVALWKKMGAMMRDRGYAKPIGFQLMVILCWFGGEFAGAFVTAFVMAAGGQKATGFIPYVGAILTAVVATGLLFLVASRFARRLPEPPPFPRNPSGPPYPPM